MMNHIKKIRNNFSWKRYCLICGIQILYSFIRVVAPTLRGPDLYSYSYGCIYPWLVIYKNTNIGISNILQCVSACGYLGIEWFPQYIFIEAAILYFVGITMKILLQKK